MDTRTKNKLRNALSKAHHSFRDIRVTANAVSVLQKAQTVVAEAVETAEAALANTSKQNSYGSRRPCGQAATNDGLPLGSTHKSKDLSSPGTEDDYEGDVGIETEWINNKVNCDNGKLQQQRFQLRLLRANELFKETEQRSSRRKIANSVAGSTSSINKGYFIQVERLAQAPSSKRVELARLPIASASPILGGKLHTLDFTATPEDVLVISLLNSHLKPVAAIRHPVQFLLLDKNKKQSNASNATKRNKNQWIYLKRRDPLSFVMPRIQLRLTPYPPTGTTSLRDSASSYAVRVNPTPSIPSHPVRLNVYDVSLNSKITKLNRYLKPLGAGGIFHAAIEIHGQEYSFGGTEDPTFAGTGVFVCPPKQCPVHRFKESIVLGDCELSPTQVQAMVQQHLEPAWLARDYNLFRKNCCFFAQELAIQLGVGDLPTWVYRLAQTTQGVEPKLIQINNYAIEWKKKREQAMKNRTVNRQQVIK